ncbi:MAG TPA: aldehyde dehydrogenase family protein [Methanomassiliicoccales archaeon]|jgi:1-pyrroline-5-carboxylate dehydrogenase
MPFKSENTFLTMVNARDESHFHVRYERAVSNLECLKGETTDYPMFINGKTVRTEKYFDDLSPVDTSIVVGRFPKGTKEDVNAAVDAARKAAPKWRRMDLDSRLAIFKKTAEIMNSEKFELAAALTMDAGKNRYEAVAEVDEAVDFVRYYTDTMAEYNGFVEDTKPAYDDEFPISVMVPWGAFAVVAPFNFPMAITTGMTAAALITGNTVVLKPSSAAPMMPYLLYDVLWRAGLPPGVLNVVSGSGGEVGDALVRHPEINGIAFTGSKQVGYELISMNPKRYPIPVITEMGGKNPCIVSDKADLGQAIPGVIGSAYTYCGQKCSALSRVYVQEKVYKEFMKLLVNTVRSLKVADPRENDTVLGPLIHGEARQKFDEYVEIAQRDGGKVTGGKHVEDGDLGRGFYVEPTIVENLPEDHKLVKQELFVPILCVQKYRKFEDAVRMANDVEYGLTAGIYSRDHNELDHFFENIEAGVVYANRRRGATTGSMVGAQPFGGWKQSGSTGKNSGSPWYLTQYMKMQSRTLGK